MDLPKPFVKWAGGKRQLIEQLIQYAPSHFNGYFEPFLGGGAFFFKLSSLGRINKAYLNDSNEELINAYNVIKENPLHLISELESGSYKNNKETFINIRKTHPTNTIKAAARFIYLNKTAFNGLYRVNSNGQFNAPFGRYNNPLICDEDNILAVSRALQKDELTCMDFEDAVNDAEEGDLVYFDPPYAPLNATSNFTGYTKDSFSEKDQEKLAKTFSKLDRRGCFVMLSNSYTPLVLDLYDEFKVNTVMASRVINCKAERRGKIKEVIVTNDYLQAIPKSLMAYVCAKGDIGTSSV
jgi:DNA adenine methylase